MKPLISIIIRTYNEGKNLSHCLNAIKNQSYSNYEIIVVDCGSQDETINIAKSFRCKIINIKKSLFTFGYALNIGAQKSNGDFFVSISAHAVPKNQFWLENLVGQFSKKNNIAGIYGRQVPFQNASPIEKRGLIEAYPEIHHCIIQKKVRFSNANSVISRKVWEKFMFNEKLEGAEDIDWCARVQKAKFLVLYNPLAVVYHSHQESVRQVYNRFYRESKSLYVMGGGIIKKHNIINYALRWIKSVFLDYIFLLKNFSNNSKRWYFLIPIYRYAVYFGQYKGIKDAKK